MSFMSNHVIHVKSCHSCQIMSFMSNHVIHVKSCHSCQIMSFMSNHANHVKSCHSCQIMSFMKNHVIHVKSYHSCQSCQSCQIMSFISNDVIHVKSCHSCQMMSFMSNNVIQGTAAIIRAKKWCKWPLGTLITPVPTWSPRQVSIILMIYIQYERRLSACLIKQKQLTSGLIIAYMYIGMTSSARFSETIH
jgi:hypothetical protein